MFMELALLIGLRNPKALIMGSSINTSAVEEFKKLFTSKLLVFVEENFEECFVKSSTNLFNELLNVKDSRWNLIHERYNFFEITAVYKNGKNSRIIDTIKDIKETCPYQKIVKLPDGVISLNVKQLEYSECYGYHIEYLNEKDEIIIDVEEDGYIHFNFPLRLSSYGKIMKTCIELGESISKKTSMKDPFMAFSSKNIVLFVYENGKYSPLLIDQKMITMDCISFFQDKPVIGVEAKEMKETNPSFVVYDLLEIMSMDPKDVQQKDEWGFKVIHTQDADKPLLLQFETFNGTRKATPSFLIAVILKKLTKAYKDKVGKKLTEILILNRRDSEKINDQIKKAFDLLNIKCKVFGCK